MSIARPTILQIIPRLDTGGAELSTLEIVDAIVRAGGRSLVATEGGRLASIVTERGGEVIAFPAASKNPIRMMANVRTLGAFIHRHGVNLLHARSRAPAWSALAAARRARIAFVTTYHGAYAERGSFKRLYNGVMARGDTVIANSQFTADLIRRRYGTPHERLRVIHRGVDCTQFDPAAISDARIAALRARWNITSSGRVVLLPARLTAWKGQAVLIEAGRLLKERGLLRDVIIVLAGDAQGRDGYVNDLRKRIASAGLKGCVRLVGHVDDMPAAYWIAHVTVVASVEPEAFGRVTTEAQAMASPVIASDIGAPPETLLAEPAVPAERATGWLVPAGDASRLADRLAAALALSPSARSAMGQRARSHVQERFTLDAMKRETLRVYDRLLGTDLAARFDKSGHVDSTRANARVQLDLTRGLAESDRQ